MQGGHPDADAKENIALETIWGRRFRGRNAKKVVDMLDEGGGEVKFWRKWDAVSDIWDQFQRKWTPICNSLK